MSQEDCIGILVIIILVWFIMRTRNEGFSADTREFVPVGSQRYGLRSDPLSYRDIRTDYIGENRHILTSPTGVEIYQSNDPPTKYGNNYQQVQCRNIPSEYGSNDTCWIRSDNSMYDNSNGNNYKNYNRKFKDVNRCLRPHIELVDHSNEQNYCDGFNKH